MKVINRWSTCKYWHSMTADWALFAGLSLKSQNNVFMVILDDFYENVC